MNGVDDEPLVLVVERDGPARELALHFLRELGCRVECAADGASGWQRTEELQPTLVITEILIPKLDGLALCRRIKSTDATKHVRVLVISMLAATGRARDAGADGFLIKPISEMRLAAEVERIVPATAADLQERA